MIKKTISEQGIIQSRYKCYLAGPMETLEDAGIKWRLEYQEDLWDLKTSCIIPQLEESNIVSHHKLLDLKQNNLLEHDRLMRELIDLDTSFIDKCDFMIIRWDGEISSGTFSEAFYCYKIAKKPVYLVCPRDFREVPGWFSACCSKKFHTKAELLNFLEKVYVIN